MDNKIIIFFILVLIINITPACGFNIQGIQEESNNIDYYSKGGFFYKLSHFANFFKSVYNLVGYASEAESEADSITKDSEEKRLMAEKNEKALIERNENREKIQQYLANRKLEYELANANTNLTTRTNISVKGYTSHKAVGIDKSKSITNKMNLTTELNKPYNQTINKTNTVLHHNTPIKALTEDAKDTKNNLNKHGIVVKINEIGNNTIKNNTIVQLVNVKGYIKYWLYKGNLTQDNEKFVRLFNGKEFVSIPLKHFNICFTGITLEVVSTEHDLAYTDIVGSINDIKMKSLEDSINFQNNLLLVANIIKGIGIFCSIILMIFTLIASILMLMPEITISKAAAIKLYYVALLFVGIAALTYGAGLILETVSSKFKNDYVSEKEDLTSYNM
jgi:hypothetical protein